MVLLLFLCLSTLLLSGPAEAVSRRRRQQPVNISTPIWTETTPLDNTDTAMNMSDYEDHLDASNSDSMPLMPLDIELPDLDSLDSNATESSCGFTFCDLLEPCNSEAICVTSPPPECRSSCWKDGVEVTERPPTTADPPDNFKTLHENAKTCPDFPGLSCGHGVAADCNNTESFSCVCDAGYSGAFCNDVCPLPCVHGDCDVGEAGPFCSCEHTHTGKLCDELIPDPEERARILAAILSSALAVAVILIIGIPIIMWRLRVILILKFIYMFKQYEDEDGKDFDAYVSMTSTAHTESFVYGSLRPMLENHNFKLFLQARDGPAGEVMSETILSALEKSRRTIMIITSDYITNEWNRFEYLIAQHETLKLHQRIIPIILEDVEKESVNMDKSLKHILSSIKCLKYPKAKLESVTSNSEDISENIQSPDSNRSVNSTTSFYKSGRSSSTDSFTKEEQKFEKKAAKFWKRLVLSMPKKKSQKNSSRSFLPRLRKETKYEINPLKCEDKPGYMGCSNPAISEFNFKINCFNDFNNDAFSQNLAYPCKAKDITEVRNKETEYQNGRLTSTII